MSETRQLDLSQIRLDGDTQIRAEISDALVAEYTDALARGDGFPPVVVFFVSTTGEAAVTLTTSSRVETSSFVLTSALNPVSTTTPARLTVLKPGSENVIVYVPMGTCTNRYAPDACETVTMGC